jgi:hypothetical protein
MRVICLAALAGCGGHRAPPSPPGNVGGVAAHAPDEWAAVTAGRTFHFDDRERDGAPARIALTATVDAVDTAADQWTFHLRWTATPDRPVELPTTIIVTADTVHFLDQDFPRADAAHDPSGATCFEHSYMVGDEEFVDRFCVHPDLGLVGGEGQWFPGELAWPIFHRTDLPIAR